MGKHTGFLEVDRQEARYEPASDRVRHYNEFTVPLTEGEIVRQASRCMDCGIPFCQTAEEKDGKSMGCPVHNLIPEWNHLVYNGKWKEALHRLHKTNNFPEFTGVPIFMF